MKKLYFNEKNSENMTQKMIIDMIKYSFIGCGIHGQSNEEILDNLEKFYFKNNINIKKEYLISECRDHFNTSIPILEKFDLKRYFSKNGENLSLENPFYPEENLEINEPGFLIQDSYISRYKFAIDCLFQSVKLTNYFYFLSAITFGIASIDEYLNLGANRWNSLMKNDLLLDINGNRKSIEDKLKEWIPKLSNGKKFDSGGDIYRKFRQLKKIRDEIAVHPKTANMTIKLKDFCDQVNMFRDGISKLLFELHKICAVTATITPNIIIRHSYCPDAYIK